MLDMLCRRGWNRIRLKTARQGEWVISWIERIQGFGKVPHWWPLPLIPFMDTERSAPPFKSTHVRTLTLFWGRRLGMKLLWGWKLSLVPEDWGIRKWEKFLLVLLCAYKTKFSDCLSLFSLAACPLSGVEFVSLKDQPNMWFPQPCFSLPFPADIPIAHSFPVFLLYVTPGLLFVPFTSCRSASGSLFTEAFSHRSGCCRH